MEWIFKERWWDYSNVKWNLDGYICLPASLVWGGLGYIAVRWGNVLSLDLLHLLPELVMKILILVLLLFLCVDVFASFYAADRDQQKSEAVGRNGCTD